MCSLANLRHLLVNVWNSQYGMWSGDEFAASMWNLLSGPNVASFSSVLRRCSIMLRLTLPTLLVLMTVDAPSS